MKVGYPLIVDKFLGWEQAIVDVPNSRNLPRNFAEVHNSARFSAWLIGSVGSRTGAGLNKLGVSQALCRLSSGQYGL